MHGIKLADLGDPKVFQEYCEELLSLEYPDFRSVNSTCGDEGCDGLAQNDEFWFQCYYPSPGKYPDVMDRIKKKIAKDLKKLRKPYPKNWIFLTVEKVSMDVHAYCKKQEKKYDGMRIIIWSEPNIKTRADKHSEFKERWRRALYGNEYQVLPPEGVSYSERNNLPKLVELNKKLGASLASWEYGDILKQVHTYDSAGNASIALEPKDPSAEVKATVQLRFDNSPESNQKINEIINAHKHGKEIEIDQKYIEKASININDRFIKDLHPRMGGNALIKLRPIPPPPIEAYIELFNSRKKRVLRIPNLLFEKTKEGENVVQLENSKQASQGIKFRFVYNTVTKHIKFSFYIDDKAADAVDGMQYAATLYKIVTSKKLKIYLKEFPSPIEVPVISINKEELLNTLNISKLLVDIQDGIGESIPSIYSQDQSDENEINKIFYLHRIIKNGKVERPLGTVTFTMGIGGLEVAKKILSEKWQGWKFTEENAVVNLFGKDIFLGPKIMYFDGCIDDNSRELLKKGMENSNIDGIELVIKSSDNGPLPTEVFTNWIKDAVTWISDYEKKRGDLAQ